ncbi:CPBP family intramembrane glutamic endopeptidase [Microbacterium sp. ASV49]|uniref:CPBP family intramembrane metalloprotease n=1 Tax=Microbacterium candidum TaxID=3041922 RepID=A0ABT7N1Y2_9MICO|nr:CPBP family intramembrane glutamic endopeptidase [Microbacterium sp. ASV49]MDL9980720.1 CPBP family intramembrane metalloprotease [Microbacterium sp. ASV49]
MTAVPAPNTEPSAHAGPVPAPAANARVRWGAVAAFFAIACGLAWLVVSPLWLSGRGLATPGALVLLIAMMYTPTIAVLIVMFTFKAPASDRLRSLGMWPLRPAKQVVWMMVVGLLAPFVIYGVAVAIAGSVGLVRLDLLGFSGMAENLKAAAAAVPAGKALPPVGLLVVLELVALPFGAIFNGLATFGEELGWRGWLVPALRPLGTWPALVISGAIWGFWHTPIILLGYDFGRRDVGGVLLMIGACIAWGVLFGWMRLRSASLWPSVLAHGMLNASAGLLLLFRAAGAPIDQMIVGPLGFVTWGVLAVVVIVLAATGQFRIQPELAPRRVRVKA